jgi:hypothetical protein
VKSLATIAMVLLISALAGSTALGHPDILGTPDPYWQKIAASNGAGGQVVTSDTTAGGAVHPALLRGYVYATGGAFVILALSLLRSFWFSSRRSSS